MVQSAHHSTYKSPRKASIYTVVVSVRCKGKRENYNAEGKERRTEDERGSEREEDGKWTGKRRRGLWCVSQDTHTHTHTHHIELSDCLLAFKDGIYVIRGTSSKVSPVAPVFPTFSLPAFKKSALQAC